MTFEQGCIAAIGALSTALAFVCQHLWAMVRKVEVRCEACEKDREELHVEIGQLKSQLGEARGQLGSHAHCPVPTCPFRPVPPPPALAVPVNPPPTV